MGECAMNLMGSSHLQFANVFRKFQNRLLKQHASHPNFWFRATLSDERSVFVVALKSGSDSIVRQSCTWRLWRSSSWHPVYKSKTRSVHWGQNLCHRTLSPIWPPCNCDRFPSADSSWFKVWTSKWPESRKFGPNCRQNAANLKVNRMLGRSNW